MAALKVHFESVRTPIVDLIQAQTNDPFKVLVATILSARTKDSTTSEAVSALFQKIDDADGLEAMEASVLNSIIGKVGFHREKTKHLKALPAVLKEKFGGSVPSEIDDLLQLPGVGRKTANLVRAVAFGLPAICVDVHVHRICNRWGYVKTKTPLETEMALRKILPLKHWLVVNSFIVAFGQNLCTPLRPDCKNCPIRQHCPALGVDKIRATKS
ncbi:MAG TPA: endonuclease III [Candidatus Cloacimonadota bacterium]|nr:endonuclease III [Candidatus Cloacimonadota bacterium]